MRLPFAGRPQPPLAVVHTEGDFPHARRRSVRLACCSCSSCIFLLGAGLGGLIGFFQGAAQGWKSGQEDNIPVGYRIIQALILAFIYTIALGAAGLVLGGALDALLGV